MRIGIYLSGVDRNTGGAYSFEYGVLTSLLDYKGNENIFIFSYSDDYRFNNTKINYIKLSRVNKLKEKWRISKYYISNLDKELKERQIDILWCASPLLIEPVDIPYIFTVWDLDHIIYPFFPEVSVDRTWENRENIFYNRIKRAVFVFTGTETGKSEIKKFYNVDESKIKVIPLPSPKFDNISERKIDNINSNYLFYPATYFPHKNHIRILETLLILDKKNNTKVSAVFVGHNGGNKDYIISKCKELNLSDRVFLIDFVSTKELVYLYKNAIALIFTSYFGPDNIPPLEAFSLKCPVIAARVNGAEEQLGGNALFADPDNPEDFALAVLKIMTDKDFRENMILNAFNSVNSWTFNDYTNKALSIISSFNIVRSCWGHDYDKYYKNSVFKKALKKLLNI